MSMWVLVFLQLYSYLICNFLLILALYVNNKIRNLYLYNVYTYLRNPVGKMNWVSPGGSQESFSFILLKFEQNYCIPLWFPHHRLKGWNPCLVALLWSSDENCMAQVTKAPLAELAIPVHSVLSTGFVVMPCSLLNMLSCTWLAVRLLKFQELSKESSTTLPWVWGKKTRSTATGRDCKI